MIITKQKNKNMQHVNVNCQNLEKVKEYSYLGITLSLEISSHARKYLKPRAVSQ
jgi:hypothetical protein